jgi:ribulose-5-phosphate 4-epimerase/fuculose-1-phosphate aldolase
MIKGIRGHGYFDMLEIPILENTAHECDLADALGAAIDANPRTVAVLVRRHGVYVWGKDWQEAKVHAECLDYLFAAAVEMRKLGLDASRSST